MRMALGLMVAISVCVIGAAHTVETADGVLLEGSRIIGLPEVISLDDDGVTIAVDSGRIQSLELGDGVATIVTTSSESLRGVVDLQIASITLKTDTGEMKIPVEQVSHVAFDRGSDRPRSGSAVATLKDGRQFEGDLDGSFPDELTVDTGGIATSTRVRSMSSIQFGDPTAIGTPSGEVVGTLKTSLPSFVELETRFGLYRVPVEMLSKMQLTASHSMSASERSSNTAGIGFKIRQGLPFVAGNLSLGNLGVECAVGFGAMAGSGSMVDVTALWYSGSVRYMVLMSGLEQFVRPYLGVGILGVTASASAGGMSASISTFGFDAGVGVDIPLAGLGIPLTVFAGSDWAFLGGTGLIGYQLGVRLDFNL